jgi:hypothetical protein
MRRDEVEIEFMKTSLQLGFTEYFGTNAKVRSLRETIQPTCNSFGRQRTEDGSFFTGALTTSQKPSSILFATCSVRWTRKLPFDENPHTR